MSAKRYARFLLVVGLCGCGTGLAADSRAGLDVVLAVDNSGSMKTNDPHALARSAVGDFVRRLGASDRAALLIFDETPRLLVPLSAPQEGSWRELGAVLEQLDYGGQWTNSPAAIERALYSLVHEGRKEAHKTILFLTDGVVDTGNPASDREMTQWAKGPLADQAARAGVRVFAVALSEKADFSLIQTLAVKTGGEYYRVPEANGLEDTFRGIAHALTARPSPDESALVAQVTESAIEPPRQTLPVSPSESPAGIIPPEPGDASVAPSFPTHSGERGGRLGPTLFVAGAVLLLLIAAIGYWFWRRSRPGETRAAATSPAESDGTELAEGGWEPVPSRDSTPGEGSPPPERSEPALALPVSGVYGSSKNIAYLEDNSGITGKTTIPLIQGLTIIGRIRGPVEGGEEYLVIEDAMISRRHATINYRDLAYWVTDQGSSNGTFINDKPVEGAVYLKNGDVLRIARFAFTFHLPAMEAGEETIKFGLD